MWCAIQCMLRERHWKQRNLPAANTWVWELKRRTKCLQLRRWSCSQQQDLCAAENFQCCSSHAFRRREPTLLHNISYIKKARLSTCGKRKVDSLYLSLSSGRDVPASGGDAEYQTGIPVLCVGAPDWRYLRLSHNDSPKKATCKIGELHYKMPTTQKRHSRWHLLLIDRENIWDLTTDRTKSSVRNWGLSRQYSDEACRVH